ncbi:Uncharacterized protein APZ42_020768 [Daphnia magna]|uniref:Uncharacterized protein n=1 Tax=Daphnia magna TaxID=35525 RepID=A0A164XDH8_9CRUS|nr:Uncharacterized protein APZ42_020768 [Daphnia magna]
MHAIVGPKRQADSGSVGKSTTCSSFLVFFASGNGRPPTTAQRNFPLCLEFCVRNVMALEDILMPSSASAALLLSFLEYRIHNWLSKIRSAIARKKWSIAKSCYLPLCVMK